MRRDSNWFDCEAKLLAPYAMLSNRSLGRVYSEPQHEYRTIFQRDRERIIHSTAFRRLMGKTQVLVGQMNDHHRNRLTHSLEVAQISRTISRRLGLNEDLTEAIALAHDIGHPPFGHAGEAELNECVQSFGGFNHNLYGLRRVECLEVRYPEFPGLNLSWELRESFVQHSQVVGKYQEYLSVGRPLLETQLVDQADSLAYDTHDIEDALGIGLIEISDLDGLAFWERNIQVVRQNYPKLSGESLKIAILREMIAWQVTDLIQESEQRLRQFQIRTIEDVRNCREQLIDFSEPLRLAKTELEAFLQQRVYNHHRVQRMAQKGRRILRLLFQEFTRSPELLPDRYRFRWKNGTEHSPTILQNLRVFPIQQDDGIERIVVDYLAGMTDRFAQQEFSQLFNPNTEP